LTLFRDGRAQSGSDHRPNSANTIVRNDLACATPACKSSRQPVTTLPLAEELSAYRRELIGEASEAADGRDHLPTAEELLDSLHDCDFT
jgi:hypothetical protein